MKTPLSRVALFTLSGFAALAAAAAPAHFDPLGKAPSDHTVQAQQVQRSALPFADRTDFEESARGFIAAPAERQIKDASGKVIWSLGSYDWLLDDKPLNSIHPSLQRQAQLNMAYGLYEVLPGRIYQVRGFDLANISFIKGETGWIVFDVGTTRETAKAALDFVNATLGRRPVVAVVYSHAHADHFGGVRGMIDEADVKSGKVQVIAPGHFMEHAVSENIFAGNAMTRRLEYAYGTILPRNPFGHVDQAIGKNVADGTIGLIAPTRQIFMPYEELSLDGVKIVFQNTPGTECPAEMNAWFPDWKAFWAAENITGTIHNIYTLRGALVRDAMEWSRQINQALYRYGRQAEVMFSAHSWPRFGNARIQQVMRAQRDTYAHLNNDVLNKANQGVTINEIHNAYQLPASLKQNWAAHSYHGSEEHNSRAVINRYLGYWDANPATLIPLSPRDSAPEYVAMMGGAKKILARAKQLHTQGKYLLAVELLNKLVYAEPQNQAARRLLADCFEQIGYQKESVALRNSFLAAALELRHGMAKEFKTRTASPELLAAVPTELLLEGLAIRVNSGKVEKLGLSFVANIATPDTGETFVLEMSNSVLTTIRGFSRPDATLSLTAPRLALLAFLGGQVSLEDLVKGGKAKLEGDPTPLARLREAVDQFTPNFEILPGTAARK